MTKLLKKYMFSEDIPIEGRMFNVVVGCGTLGAVLALVLNVVLGGISYNAGYIFLFAILMLAAIIIANVKKKYLFVGTIVYALVFCVLYPLVYFFTGGILSGMPSWFVLEIVLLFVTVRGVRLLIFAICTTIVNLICIWIEFTYPTLVVKFEIYSAAQYIDIIVAYLVVASITGISIQMQYNTYSKAKENADKASNAKVEFLANMSHEIRTPLNAMLGMNEMILRENKDEAIKEYAMAIEASGKTLFSLVGDIIDFSKMESGKLDIDENPYYVTDIVCELEDMMRERAEKKGLNFDVKINAKMPDELIGDAIRIKQIALNFLSNAVKYTDKGIVTLLVDYEQEEKLLYMGVRDTGRGIRESDMINIFDSFHRIDEKRNSQIEGTGLGLAIAKKLAELMGGTISLKSEYGKGSLFCLRVPQEVADMQEVGDYRSKYKNRIKNTEMVKEEFQAPGARVLLVDDNETNLNVAIKLLKRVRVKVDTVSSGMECLSVLREKMPYRPDFSDVQPYYNLVLLDHMMPAMDGIETLQKIREELLAEGVPIIALTANAVNGAKQKYIDAGFSDYVAKPVRGEELEWVLYNYLPKSLIIPVEHTLVEANDGHDTYDAMIRTKLAAFADAEEAGKHTNTGAKGIAANVAFTVQGMPKMIKDIKNAFEDKNWSDYAIYAHAMKSVLTTVGVMDIAATAKEMEIAAKGLDLLKIYQEQNEFVYAMEDILYKMTTFLKDIEWNEEG